MDNLYADQAELDRRKETRRRELEAMRASKSGRVGSIDFHGADCLLE